MALMGLNRVDKIVDKINFVNALGGHFLGFFGAFKPPKHGVDKNLSTILSAPGVSASTLRSPNDPTGVDKIKFVNNGVNNFVGNDGPNKWIWC